MVLVATLVDFFIEILSSSSACTFSAILGLLLAHHYLINICVMVSDGTRFGAALSGYYTVIIHSLKTWTIPEHSQREFIDL